MIPVSSVQPLHAGKSQLESYILIAIGLGNVLILGTVLWFCRYGIDFTDESFYLVS